MKFSSILLFTAISAIPTFRSNKGGNGEMSDEGGYEYVNMDEPAGMESDKQQFDGCKKAHGDRKPHKSNGGQGGNGSDGEYGDSNQQSGSNDSDSNQASSGGDKGSASDQQKLDELNAIRAKVGAAPLQISSKLTQAAQKHSDYQARARSMSHAGANGSNPTQRINAEGIRGGATGENVAWNQPTWSAATQVWIKSPGHYKNMIDRKFKYVGFGSTNKYYTEDFSSTN